MTNRFLSLSALFVSVCSLGLSFWARPGPDAIATEVQARIAADLWAEWKPIYKDMGLPTDRPPEKVSDIFRPIMPLPAPP